MEYYVCKRCGMKVDYDEKVVRPPKSMLCEDCWLGDWKLLIDKLHSWRDNPEYRRFLNEKLSDHYVDQIAKKYLEKVREERVLELREEIERLEGIRYE